MKPAVWAIVALLAGLRLIWPGDASFVNDEAMLLGRAWESVQTGVWPDHGLMGSLGTPYGPFAIWIYALLLRLTTALPGLVLASALLVTAATVFALYRFSKLVDFGGFAWVALLSPYLWFYSRTLWDNSFLVPLTAIAFVSFLSFEKTGRHRDLLAALLASTLAILTHLMSLPLLLAIVVLLGWKHRDHVRKHLLVVGGFFVGCGLLSLPYLSTLLGAPARGGPSLDLDSLLFPLLGARIFSAVGLDYVLGEGWTSELVSGLTAVSWILVALSALAYVFSWLGMWIALRSWRNHLLALLLFGFSWLMLSGSGRSYHPHYYNGLWFSTLYFLCLGLSAAWSRKAWGRGLAAGWIVSLVVLLPCVPALIHRDHGTRSLRYGPTLDNLMSVAAQLRQYDPESEVVGNTTNSRHFFHALVFLRDFPEAAPTPLPRRSLEIRYADGDSGRIELVERD